MIRTPIIATGISGLVGSRIAELLQKEYEFISFSLDKGIDITNLQLLKTSLAKYPKAKTVLHLAAFTDVNAAFVQNGDKNGSCYKVNVIGSKNIAQLCYKTKRYLINISTDFVFDGINPPPGGYTEKDKPRPIEWYGETKLLAEREIKKSGCKHCVLRTAFPFKSQQASNNLEPIIKLDLVRQIINQLKDKKPMTRFTDQIITPTFIDDITKVIAKCFAVQPEGVFHCVGSTSLSPYDLAVKTADAFNLDKKLIKKSSLKDFLKQNPNSRPRQKKMTLFNKKIKEKLGIKMSTIEEALTEIKKQIGILQA